MNDTATAATKAKAKAEIKMVTMDDGRVVEFAGKKKMQKESAVNDEGLVEIRLDFVNGETRKYMLPASLKDRAACHGTDQKFGDEIAGIDDVDDCVLAIDELAERLAAGEWNSKREASGFAGTSVLLKAIVEKTGADIAKVRERLKMKSQADKMAMRNSAELKPIIERLEAEKAAKGPKIDMAAELADFAA